MGFGDDTFNKMFGIKPAKPTPSAPASTSDISGVNTSLPQFQGATLTGPSGYRVRETPAGFGQVLSPSQVRMRLYEVFGTAAQPSINLDDFVAMEYAPEEWMDEKASDYEDEGEDVAVTRPQFKTSKGRRISMTLFFNDWGRSVESNPSVDGKRVEQKIDWLHRHQVPHPQSIAGAKAPHVLAFVWKEVFMCVLTRVNVTRLKLHPRQLTAMRANVDIELVEWVPEAI